MINKLTRRQITIDFEVGEEDEAEIIFDKIHNLLDGPDAVGFLSMGSVIDGTLYSRLGDLVRDAKRYQNMRKAEWICRRTNMTPEEIDQLNDAEIAHKAGVV
jgi:hypothetical protein